MRLKKSDGDASGITVMTVVLIAMIVFAMIAIIMIDSSKALDTKNRVIHVCDGYIELMMSEGCLTDDDKDLLEAELRDIGCYDIDFSGTTTTPGDYGTVIELSVTYKIDLSMHTVTSLLSANIEEGAVADKYTRKTTSYR